MRLQYLMLADAMTPTPSMPDATGYEFDPRTPAEKARDAADFGRTVAESRALVERSKREQWSPERFWAERISRRKPWVTLGDLIVYLSGEWFYWTGHAPVEAEQRTIVQIASAMWARRESERSVPQERIA